MKFEIPLLHLLGTKFYYLRGVPPTVMKKYTNQPLFANTLVRLSYPISSKGTFLGCLSMTNNCGPIIQRLKYYCRRRVLNKAPKKTAPVISFPFSIPCFPFCLQKTPSDVILELFHFLANRAFSGRAIPNKHNLMAKMSQPPWRPLPSEKTRENLLASAAMTRHTESFFSTH